MNKYKRKYETLVKFLKDNTVLGEWIWNLHYPKRKLTGPESRMFYKSKIQDQWKRIANENGISHSEENALLKELKENKYLSSNADGSFVTRMKLYISKNESNYIFYAREFQDETLPVYREIKKVVKEKFSLDIVMLEEDPKSGNIHNYMKERISNCLFMIADLSSYKGSDYINNNVIYEIGLAHGKNKQVIQIVNKSKKLFNIDSDNKIPFDISPHTTIEYNDDESTESITKLIGSTIKSLEK